VTVQLEIYESPRYGVRMQIQVDTPGRKEVQNLQDLGMGEYDLLHTLLVEEGPGEVLDKTEKPIFPKKFGLRRGREVNPIMKAVTIDNDEVVIVTFLSGEVIGEVFALRPRLDPVMLLLDAGRMFYQRIHYTASELSTES